ncbi:hypothetical protein CYLTODRAFT_491555 [Cylindrobasidium torrendii FP15055 ss-10]|uniref:NYN domain-containing protein n=1 Tax=Cylindrobasidium torrendii FP15055 ss-10 TaxID=1314674 RepID=A0A0D7B6Y3_9AGAR|nr:hypothetical protein CYLTODRAFT_491555 [Cylindrobasidium torrendii FP15055 ss-10]
MADQRLRSELFLSPPSAMLVPQRTGIFWDHTSCPAPDGALGDVVVESLRDLASGSGGRAQLRFTVYMDAIDQADRIEFCHELQACGVELVTTTLRGRGQASTMLVDALLFSHQGSPQNTVIVLVAGDQTFAYAVAILEKLGCRTMVVAPDVPGSRLLKARTSHTVNWHDVLNRINILPAVPPPIVLDEAHPRIRTESEVDITARTSPRNQCLQLQATEARVSETIFPPPVPSMGSIADELSQSAQENDARETPLPVDAPPPPPPPRRKRSAARKTSRFLTVASKPVNHTNTMRPYSTMRARFMPKKPMMK